MRCAGGVQSQAGTTCADAGDERAELPPLPAPLRGRWPGRIVRPKARQGVRAPRAGRPDRMGARAVPEPPCGLVKHFHDHLCAHHGFAWSYTWTKTTLQRAGLVSKAPRRGAHARGVHDAGSRQAGRRVDAARAFAEGIDLDVPGRPCRVRRALTARRERALHPPGPPRQGTGVGGDREKRPSYLSHMPVGDARRQTARSPAPRKARIRHAVGKPVTAVFRPRQVVAPRSGHMIRMPTCAVPEMPDEPRVVPGAPRRGSALPECEPSA